MKERFCGTCVYFRRGDKGSFCHFPVPIIHKLSNKELEPSGKQLASDCPHYSRRITARHTENEISALTLICPEYNLRKEVSEARIVQIIGENPTAISYVDRAVISVNSWKWMINLRNEWLFDYIPWDILPEEEFAGLAAYFPEKVPTHLYHRIRDGEVWIELIHEFGLEIAGQINFVNFNMDTLITLLKEHNDVFPYIRDRLNPERISKRAWMLIHHLDENYVINNIDDKNLHLPEMFITKYRKDHVDI